MASRCVWRALATSIPVDELQFGARLEGAGFDGTVARGSVATDGPDDETRRSRCAFGVARPQRAAAASRFRL